MVKNCSQTCHQALKVYRVCSLHGFSEFSQFPVRLMLTDTSPEMAQLKRTLWAKLPLEKRLRQIAGLTRSVRSLTRWGIANRHPEWNDQQINAEFARRVYGINPNEALFLSGMNTIEIPSALLPILNACKKLNLRYRIGGSLASSLYGEPRATNDVDVVIALTPEDAEPFVRELNSEYVIYADSLRSAIIRQTCINALHSETVFKIDIFPLKSREYDQQAHSRFTKVEIEQNGQFHSLFFATPEDILIAKLEWYRKGNEQSEQQWRDIVGLLQADLTFLDFDYLENWVKELELWDLYQRALEVIRTEPQSDE